MKQISGIEAHVKLIEALSAEEETAKHENHDSLGEILNELKRLNNLMAKSLETQEAILSELRRPSRTTLMG